MGDELRNRLTFGPEKERDFMIYKVEAVVVAAKRFVSGHHQPIRLKKFISIAASNDLKNLLLSFLFLSFVS